MSSHTNRLVENHTITNMNLVDSRDTSEKRYKLFWGIDDCNKGNKKR